MTLSWKRGSGIEAGREWSTSERSKRVRAADVGFGKGFDRSMGTATGMPTGTATETASGLGGASGSSSSGPYSIVELVDVDKDYRLELAGSGSSRIHALARVSLKLQDGEFVFLTGPSGAGKSTLLRLVLGLDQPSAGQVRTLGCDVAQMNESQRRALRRQIGIIFQDHRLLESINVFENVELPLVFQGMARLERERRVLELLEIVQMSHQALSSVNTLSAGEKQRIGIARALAISPRLVVADEPTGNLDPVAARSLIRMLRELKGHGTTVLIATHDMSLVRDFGGRVLEIVGGSLPTQSSVNQRSYRVPSFWKSEVSRDL